MDRNIPHVLDVFASSPGERRRMLMREREEEREIPRQLKDQQKNPGSDSAVCLCSSSSDEDERNISKYFDYLDEDADDSFGKKNKNSKSETNLGEKKDVEPESGKVKTSRDSRDTGGHQKENGKHELEKDIKQIERHLSMKKTIRKKMMRDLQQAFVEDPKEFQQDRECIPPDKKNNINIHNLTISKKRMSKSEHSFLDMLKENEMKDRKMSRGQVEGKHQKNSSKRTSKNKYVDTDSGNASPTRESLSQHQNQKLLESRENILSSKEEKKTFWQRLTGKSKTKR